MAGAMQVLDGGSTGGTFDKDGDSWVYGAYDIEGNAPPGMGLAEWGD